jgi:aryl-alcohol dehydrogenase-like predicted oxidoreductase
VKNFEKNKSKVKVLQDMAKQKRCTASQLALAWVLHQGNDILPLFGTTKKERLKENIEAAEIKLTADELDSLEKTFPRRCICGNKICSTSNGYGG